MSENDRIKINIDRDKETRTKEISKMIGEGGLGARAEYYDIEKTSSTDDESKDDETKKD